MQVHLVDGTYELFRHHFGQNGQRQNSAGEEIGATRGVIRSLVGMLEDGATHVGVATDQVIESFRNDLYPGYKTGEGIDPALFSQFPLLDAALAAAGFTVWSMVDVEADDALASAAKVAAATDAVERAFICTPDKDLAQCVTDPVVVQLDRRNQQIRDEAATKEKYGVAPASIPDWLALVGDSADGFPGLPGWGAKSAAAVLSRYGHIDQIPRAPGQWDITVRGAAKLAATLSDQYDDAMLFRTLATLIDDVDVGSVADWEWTGPTADLAGWCERLELRDIPGRLAALAR